MFSATRTWPDLNFATQTGAECHSSYGTGAKGWEEMRYPLCGDLLAPLTGRVAGSILPLCWHSEPGKQANRAERSRGKAEQNFLSLPLVSSQRDVWCPEGPAGTL